MEDAIRILLVGEDEDNSSLLSLVLQREAGLAIVGRARTGGELLIRVLDASPDVLLIDLDAPGQAVVTAIAETQISSLRGAPVRVVGLTDRDQVEPGAVGVLDALIHKGRPLKQLLVTLRDVVAAKASDVVAQPPLPESPAVARDAPVQREAERDVQPQRAFPEPRPRVWLDPAAAMAAASAAAMATAEAAAPAALPATPSPSRRAVDEPMATIPSSPRGPAPASPPPGSEPVVRPQVAEPAAAVPPPLLSSEPAEPPPVAEPVAAVPPPLLSSEPAEPPPVAEPVGEISPQPGARGFSFLAAAPLVEPQVVPLEVVAESPGSLSARLAASAAARAAHPAQPQSERIASPLDDEPDLQDGPADDGGVLSRLAALMEDEDEPTAPVESAGAVYEQPRQPSAGAAAQDASPKMAAATQSGRLPAPVPAPEAPAPRQASEPGAGSTSDALLTMGSVNLIASPFNSFRSLAAFQQAVGAIEGVRTVRTRRFHRGILSATVHYDGLVPLVEHLTRLVQFNPQVVASRPGSVELRISAGEDPAPSAGGAPGPG